MLSRLGPLAGTRALPSPYQARDRWGRVHSGGHRVPGTWAGYHILCGRYRVRFLFLYGGDAFLGGGAMGTPVGGIRSLSGHPDTAENKERKMAKTKGALGRSRG